ncbi:unnamed protein product [Peniophora sp. CBMAI 1063]|nr:unnamed protein product [Peniophora sp. CBMAI 1063]
MNVILTIPRALTVLSPSLPTFGHLTFSAQLVPFLDSDQEYGQCQNDRLVISAPSLDRPVQIGRLRDGADWFTLTWNRATEFDSSTFSIACSRNGTMTIHGIPLAANQSKKLQDNDTVEFRDTRSSFRLIFSYRKKYVFRSPRSTLYDVVKLAGEGGNGAVFFCRQAGVGRAVAIKSAQAPSVNADGTQPPSSEAQALALIWMEVKKQNDRLPAGARWPEPNIVRMYEQWAYAQTHTQYIVMDLAIGNLFDLVPSVSVDERSVAPYTIRLPENKVLSAARNIVDGLMFIHMLDLVHGDIKPNNYLLHVPLDPTTGMYRVILADFGSCKRITALKKMSVAKKPYIGTPGYMAPEVASPSHVYTPLVDVWAAGLTIYYLFTGVSLFRSATAEDVRKIAEASKHWTRLERTESISLGAISFLRGCLELDHNKRFNSLAAASDPWIYSVERANPLLDAMAEHMKRGSEAPAQVQKRARDQISKTPPEHGDQKRARDTLLP